MRKLALMVAVLMLASLPAAGAEEAPATDLSSDMEEEQMMLSFTYDATEFKLFYRLGVKGEGDCSTRDDQAACTAVEVIGKNGQVNHGTIMSIFARSLAPGKGKGCLVSQIAGSGFGKGDNKVKANPDPEAADDGEAAELTDPETPEFEDATDKPERLDYRQYCNKGPKETPPGQAKKQERASADSAG